MTRKVQIINIGDSLGIELPAEIVEKLKPGPDGSSLLSESPFGFVITAYDEVARQMEIAERIMAEDRELLSRLALQGD